VLHCDVLRGQGDVPLRHLERRMAEDLLQTEDVVVPLYESPDGYHCRGRRRLNRDEPGRSGMERDESSQSAVVVSTAVSRRFRLPRQAAGVPVWMHSVWQDELLTG